MNSSASPQYVRRVDPWLVAIVLISAAAGALIVARARNWAVMTDELLYTGMARSIAHSILPLAQVRGESVSINQVLFPTLIAPLVGTLSMPTAYPFIAALNGIVFATAAIPAYLLTNLVTANRTAARWVAVCTVATPWLAFASKALPDPLAYVAVLWAAYAMVRTAGAHSRPLKGDLLTLVAIAFAYLVRNQFLLLVGVWIGAVVLIRIGETLGNQTWREIPKQLLALLKDRPVPIITFAVVILIVKFHPTTLLGLYTITTTSARGGAAPSGLIHAFFNHASVVALGVAGLPFVLGLPWLAVALTRVKDRIQNDAAIVIVLLSVAVLYVGASFDVRFTESDRVIERYVFYFAPLMLVAMAAFFAKPPKNLLSFAIPAIAGLLLLNVNQPFGLDSRLSLSINHAFSPMQIGLVVYQQAADAIGTSIFGLLALTLTVIGGLVWWLINTDRAAIAQNGSFAILLVVLLTTTGYAVPKIVNLQNDLVNKIYGDRTANEKAWLKPASDGEKTSLVFTPRIDITNRSNIKPTERISNWWDLAFWNGSISSVYVAAGGNPQLGTPFPGAAHTMKPDWETGRLDRATDDKAHYLTQAESNPVFQPQYTGEPATSSGYVVYDTGTKATAAWATQGLTKLGWVPPAGATLRVWAPRFATETSLLTVNLWMATTRRPPVLTGFRIQGAQAVLARREGRRTRYAWPVKIPVGGHADFKLIRGAGNAHVEQVRVIGPLG